MEQVSKETEDPVEEPKNKDTKLDFEIVKQEDLKNAEQKSQKNETENDTKESFLDEPPKKRSRTPSVDSLDSNNSLDPERYSQMVQDEKLATVSEPKKSWKKLVVKKDQSDEEEDCQTKDGKKVIGKTSSLKSKKNHDENFHSLPDSETASNGNYEKHDDIYYPGRPHRNYNNNNHPPFKSKFNTKISSSSLKFRSDESSIHHPRVPFKQHQQQQYPPQHQQHHHHHHPQPQSATWTYHHQHVPKSMHQPAQFAGNTTYVAVPAVHMYDQNYSQPVAAVKPREYLKFDPFLEHPNWGTYSQSKKRSIKNKWKKKNNIF